MEPTSGRANCSVLVRDTEVERAAIGQSERQLMTVSMKFGDVEAVNRRNTTFHFYVRRGSLARLIGKMLVHVEMVVNQPATTAFVENISLRHGLLDESLHESV